jgi:hypothetical protein
MSLIFPPHPDDFKFLEAKSPYLVIHTISDSEYDLVLHGITKTGFIQHKFTSPAEFNIEPIHIALTEIPLAITLLTTSSFIQRGHLFAQITLQFSQVPSVTLAADYVTSFSGLSWPPCLIKSSADPPGAIIIKDLPDPPAGSNFSFQLHSTISLKVSAISFTLTTSPAVATRTAYGEVQTSIGIPTAAFIASASQAASKTYNYTFTNYHIVPSQVGNTINGHLSPFTLYPDSKINSIITNLQAADQISQILVHGEQLLISEFASII